MNRLEVEQRERNRKSRSAWDLYARHRERVTSLITGNETAAGGRLCVFGAGNCNDIDLARLCTAFDEVHLVDLDEESLSAGVATQRCARNESVVLHGGVDLSGICGSLAKLANRDVTTDDIAELNRLITTEPFSEVAKSCDVTVSVGLLSQLIEPVLKTVTDVAQAVPLVQALRQRHLRMLIEQCASGGRALLITEIVSADTAPEIDQTPESELPQLLAGLLAKKNFFTGLHPAILLQELKDLAAEYGSANAVSVVAPWKWEFVYRTYAVTAFEVGMA